MNHRSFRQQIGENEQPVHPSRRRQESRSEQPWLLAQEPGYEEEDLNVFLKRELYAFLNHDLQEILPGLKLFIPLIHQSAGAL